ncbi:MAG: aminoacyl-tRNA hydrolase [Bacilli bacterium]
MKLVIGLGNPGSKYAHTRHNMGFELVDMLAEDLRAPAYKKKFNALYTKVNFRGEVVYIMKPLTYMNLSGEAVKPFVDYYNIDIDDIIVVLDDMALEPGRFRLRKKGSSGGQKGLGNIIDLLHTKNIKRIRIGTGEPKDKNVVDYVLTVPKGDEADKIEEALDEALLALKYAILTNFDKAMTNFNSKKVNKIDD